MTLVTEKNPSRRTGRLATFFIEVDLKADFPNKLDDPGIASIGLRISPF